MVEVSDSGTGIAPENVAKIYDRSIQLRVGQGTGLGLAVSYGLFGAIRPHQRRKRPGRGTTFRITLPTAMVRTFAGSWRVMQNPDESGSDRVLDQPSPTFLRNCRGS